MMHRCSSSNVVGGCTCGCGMYHTQSCNSFSMLFSMNNGYRGYDEGAETYSFSNSPSSSVDCTLSLGTPSTRLTSENGNHGEKKRSSRMSAFGWNILPSKQSPAPPSNSKSHRGGSSGNSGGDPLLARRCANCDTTSTPLWRNGPRGPKSLCNACGIRFKKEERRAAAATSNGGGHGAMETQQMMNDTWAVHPQKSPYYYGNEYQFLQEDNHLNSWRFNVTDRTSFVHDFTR